MATLAESGTQLHECPTCHYITPCPAGVEEPVCLKCIQRQWPEDFDIRQAERRAFILIVKLAIGGMVLLVIALAGLSKLSGYL